MAETDVVGAHVVGTEQPGRAQFERWVVDLRPALLAYVRRRGGDVDTDDVVAEALSAAWRSRANLPAEPDERRAFVFRIARNKLVDACRSRGRRVDAVRALGSLSASCVDDPAGLVVLTETVEGWVQRLPAAEREAMRLTIAGLTPAEGARVLGCGPSAFTSRVERARRRMRAWSRDGDADAAGLATPTGDIVTHVTRPPA